MAASDIAVLYPNNRNVAFIAKPHEIAKLVHFECVQLDQREMPRYAWLLVPLEVADAVLDSPKHVRNPKGVTRKKQDPGAGKWVQRADMAGRGAGTLAPTTIHFAMGHREATA